MLAFARQQVGKPFSNSAMARSLFWPRVTHRKDFFCAELVADVLRVGGLIDPSSNPGAATPAGLYDLYKTRATATANPYLLRQVGCTSTLTTSSIVSSRTPYSPPQIETASRIDVHTRRHAAIALQVCGSTQATERLSSGLHVLNHGVGGGARPSAPTLPIGLTLKSLDMRRR